MPDITKANIQAYDKTAKEYDEWANSYNMQSAYEQFREYMDKTEGVIIDVGSGTGRDARALTDSGYEVHGVDLSDNMLQIAKIKARNATFHKMDFRHLEFDDNHFDGFWANASLFLVVRPELEESIKELYRVTRKGGTGYLSFEEGEGLKIKEVDKETKKQQELYSYSEVRDLLKEVGFRVLMTERKEDQKRKGLFWLRYFVRKV
ncbi:class I SAM-dependent methyltransferase [Patescibacteria group bacterium]|nr:class I SAM-dependent methyltransferase [Patescibacteria group bacterium]